MTHDRWHMTCDKCHIVWGRLSLKKFSFLTFTVCDSWCAEDLEEKDHSVSQLVNHEGVSKNIPGYTGFVQNPHQMWRFLDLNTFMT